MDKEEEKMKITFASKYTRAISYEEYPIEVFCYGKFQVKNCRLYNEDCPQSCSFAKSKCRENEKEDLASKDTSSSYSPLFSYPPSRFRNGLERFLAKWGAKWKK